MSGNAQAIRAAADGVPTRCSPSPSAGGTLVKCPKGVAAGTEIPVIRATGCELIYPEESPGGIDGTIESYAERERMLSAVFEETETEPYLNWVPRGSYVVVIDGWPSPGSGAAFHVHGDRIVGIQFGCGHSPADFYDGVDTARFLVGPVDTP